MKHCASPSCPHRRDTGAPAEYRDDVSACVDCGSPLASGRSPTSVSPQPQRLVTIARFVNVQLAHLVRGRLEAEGILAFLADQHLVGIERAYAHVVGGIRLQVPEDSVEEAVEILDSAEMLAEDEAGDDDDFDERFLPPHDDTL